MDGRKKAAIVVPVAVAAAAIVIVALWQSMATGDGPPPAPRPGGNSTDDGGKVPVNILSSPSAFPFVDKWVAQYNAERNLGTAKADYDHEADEPFQYQNVTGFLSENGADIAIAGRVPSGWGNETVLMPVSPQAIAVAYNVPGLPDVPSGLKLDQPTLAAMFSGNITQWDDPRIKDKNPDTALPAEKIVVVHEGRAGSPSDLLAQYLGNDTVWAADSLMADSPEDLSATVRQTPYSVGYIDFSYAIQTRMTYAALANSDGEYVLPSLDSIGRAVQNGTLVQGNSTDLSFAPSTSVGRLGAGSYPIVGFYYAVLDGRELMPGTPEHEKAAAALDFANWAAGPAGQQILVDMQYPWIYDRSAALAGYAAALEERYNATISTLKYGAPANFTDNLNDSVYGQVVASGENVHVVWQESIEGRNYDILLRSSSDGGKTFGNTTNISSNAGFSEHPQLAVSGQLVHVVWPDNTSGSREIMYARSADGGETFSEPIALSARGAFNAEIAAFGNNVYLVWQMQDWIVAMISTDAGQTFGEPMVITEEGIHAESYPKVAAYGEGVHVAWLAEDGIYYSTAPVAQRFSEPMKLSGDAPAGEAQVAAYDDSVYVAWGGLHSSESDGIYVAKSTDGGTTFGAPQRIGGLSSPLNVELAVSPETGKVYVAAQAAVDGNEEIMLLTSADGGATFGEPANLSNNSGISECPSVAVAGDAVLTVWEDGTTGNHEIFMAQRPA
jgi:ABC-type phosphate transport system substrate-binding protein